MAEKSGKIRIDKNGVRENNNRPAPRNTIVNWPEGGPKPIRKREKVTNFGKARSGKF